MPFLDDLDIANRALQHCGAEPVTSPTEVSENNREVTFAFDKVRRAELRRNIWKFATRKMILRPIDTTTMLLVPAAYDATKTYLRDAVVADTNGQYWISQVEDNFNNSPGGNNEAWDAYFGPLTIQPWDDETNYYTGELVYMAGVRTGSYVIYRSLTNANDEVPNVATAWDATVTYYGDQVVSYGGQQWYSLLELNLNVAPAVGPTPYDATAIYSIGQQVVGSDDFIYTSAVNSNTGHDPVTDNNIHWTATNVPDAWALMPSNIPASSTNWAVVQATMHTLQFSYPIGTGPSSQSETRNVFRLPAGFLRVAPNDPKQGSTSFLGAPSAAAYDDWLFEGNYIISGQGTPLMLRFVADMTKVRDMDDMFCEGLACRIATAVCVKLTQSDSKLQTIASAYKLFMGEARLVNAIENGPVEPPEDELIQCRL